MGQLALFYLLQRFTCEVVPSVFHYLLVVLFVDFEKAKLLQTGVSNLVLVALAQEIVQYLFGGNCGVFENFPKTGCGFLVVLDFLLILLDIYRMFKTNS